MHGTHGPGPAPERAVGAENGASSGDRSTITELFVGIETAAPVPVSSLRPCPFCGSGATLEASPWLSESIRIVCANPACRVRPGTEYLLGRYADELCAAWNARPAVSEQTRVESPP